MYIPLGKEQKKPKKPLLECLFHLVYIKQIETYFEILFCH